MVTKKRPIESTSTVAIKASVPVLSNFDEFVCTFNTRKVFVDIGDDSIKGYVNSDVTKTSPVVHLQKNGHVRLNLGDGYITQGTYKVSDVKNGQYAVHKSEKNGIVLRQLKESTL